MKLYHGSTVTVKNPSLRLGRKNTDFGKDSTQQPISIKRHVGLAFVVNELALNPLLSPSLRSMTIYSKATI